MVHLRTLINFVGGARFFACDSCLLTSTIMRKILFSLVVSVSLALCEPPPSNQYGYPSNFGGATGNGNFAAANNYRAHGGGHSYTDHEQDGNQDYVDNYPQSYEFGYAIKDVATGNDFGRRETSDGETVRGEYRVQLPDGRTQIVTYTADWRSGFHADVRYEGTATYPDQYSTQNNNNQGYDFQGNSNSNSNNIGAGYNGGHSGAYSNYQNKGASYNDNNYQFASNSIDNNYNFGARNNFKPVYGPPFG